MSTPPRRRWFQYSLRTMFVVATMLCGALAYHLNWIGQRQEYRTKHLAECQPYVQEQLTWDFEHSVNYEKAPFPLSYFGEIGERHITVLVEATEPDQLTPI